MKINIIGPSGSGKTTLSKGLSDKLSIKPTNLDYVLYDYPVGKKRIKVNQEIANLRIRELINHDNWIIEGVFPVKQIIADAEWIIYLKPSIIVSLYRQWKRYITDPSQRDQHGFTNNLRLSRGVLKQYFEKEDTTQSDDLRYSRISKIERMLKGYEEKVLQVDSNYDMVSLAEMMSLDMYEK